MKKKAKKARAARRTPGRDLFEEAVQSTPETRPPQKHKTVMMLDCSNKRMRWVTDQIARESAARRRDPSAEPLTAADMAELLSVTQDMAANGSLASIKGVPATVTCNHACDICRRKYFKLRIDEHIQRGEWDMAIRAIRKLGGSRS